MGFAGNLPALTPNCQGQIKLLVLDLGQTGRVLRTAVAFINEIFRFHHAFINGSAMRRGL